MRRVEVGFVSFTEVPAGHHHGYNAWHQLDHLPEQYGIDGIAHGERWVATPACVAARTTTKDTPLARAQYLTLYLVTEPVDATLHELRAVAARLRDAGRFYPHRESHLYGAWRVVDRAAAARVLVDADVVPWRPATGVHVIVDDESMPRRSLAALVAAPGVVGGWMFERDPALAHPTWRTGPYRITVLWLDADPIAVAAAGLSPLVDGAVLAGPMARVEVGAWDWFDDADDADELDATAPDESSPSSSSEPGTARQR